MLSQHDIMHQVDPDQNAANGIALKTKDDMLRLDSMVMTVQLSIRKLLVRAPLAHPIAACYSSGKQLFCMYALCQPLRTMFSSGH